MTPKVAAALALIASRRIARAAKRIQRRPAVAPVKVDPPTQKLLVESSPAVAPPVEESVDSGIQIEQVPASESSPDVVPAESVVPRHKNNRNRKKARRPAEADDDSIVL